MSKFCVCGLMYTTFIIIIEKDVILAAESGSQVNGNETKQ